MIMRPFRVATIITLSGIVRMLCTTGPGAHESDDTVTFEFTKDMLIDFGYCADSLATRVSQFSMPSSDQIDDYYKWLFRPTIEAAPEVVEILGRVFEPRIKKLRDALPRYFCQPLLKGDKLRLVADLFSDQLEDIFEQIRADAELANAGAPISSLIRIVLFMALPPFYDSGKVFTWYYPQELLPIIHNIERYWEGRRKWKRSLEEAQSSGRGYEGPTPIALRWPVVTARQSNQENWDKLPDEVFLRIFCITGSYLWYARLVCKKWRLIGNAGSIAGVLGYGGAFKMLSGRATFGELSARLDSLARTALTEYKGPDYFADENGVGPSEEAVVVAAARKQGGSVGRLKEVIQAIDAVYVLCWYRDAQAKLSGLDRMIEDDVLALFTSARDDVFISMVLENVLYQRPLSEWDSSWDKSNRSICYRMFRAYLKKYPEALRGHPLPDVDTWSIWWEFKGL